MDVRDLSIEDKKFLCHAIGGKIFKRFFQQYPIKFQSIQGGFRPQKMTDEDACSFAIKHIDQSFIGGILEKVVDKNLKEIHEKRGESLAKEHNTGVADFFGIKGTIFQKNIPLYLKLENRRESDNYIELLNVLVDKSLEADKRKEEKKESEDNLKEQLSELKLEVARLKKEKGNLQTDLNYMTEEKENNDNKLKTKDKEISDLEKLLEKVKKTSKANVEKLELLQKDKLSVEEKLSRINTTFIADDEYSYMSVCKVENSGYSGSNQLQLRRIVDVKNGIVQLGRDPDIPSQRNTLYGKNLPQAGTIGVWEWSEEENRSATGHTYVKSHYNSGFKLIQVILYRVTNVDELLGAIQEGVNEDLVSDSMILGYQNNDEKFIGLYCSKNNLEKRGTKYYFKDDVYFLPLYNFSGHPFFPVGNYLFYRKGFLGNPESKVRIKNPMEIIRTLLIKRISWTNMKQNGLKRHSYQRIKSLLENMKMPSFYEEVQEACECSPEEAKNLVDQFIEQSNKHISGTDIASDVIAEIIENNNELKEKGMKISSLLWEKENEARLNEKDKELEKVKENIENAQKELTNITNEKQDAKSSLDKIETEIKDKKNLADSIDAEVKKRIHESQHEISSFAVDFMMKYGISTSIDAAHQPLIEENPCFTTGDLVKGEEIKYETSYDVAENLSINLEDAGIDHNYASSLAAYFLSAYMNHVPLILAGPNGNNIADAVSVTFTNRKAGRINFQNGFDKNAASRCHSSEDKIIAVTNPFNSQWAPYLMELLGDGKFYVLLTPFQEELKLEPVSLYNNVLPVITGQIVNHEPTGADYRGGFWNESKPSLKDEKNMNPWLDHALKACGAKPLIQNRIRQLVTVWKNISENEVTKNDESLYILYPYAYATNHMTVACECIKSERGKGTVSKEIEQLFTAGSEEGEL